MGDVGRLADVHQVEAFAGELPEVLQVEAFAGELPEVGRLAVRNLCAWLMVVDASRR